jgi:ribosomal protein L37AE/L43A
MRKEIVDLMATGENAKQTNRANLVVLRNGATTWEARQQKIRFLCESCGNEILQRLRSTTNLICFKCNREIKDFGQAVTKDRMNLFRGIRRKPDELQNGPIKSRPTPVVPPIEP